MISTFREQARLSKWVLKKLECIELVIIEINSQEDKLKLECIISLLGQGIHSLIPVQSTM